MALQPYGQKTTVPSVNNRSAHEILLSGAQPLHLVVSILVVLQQHRSDVYLKDQKALWFSGAKVCF